MKTKTNLNGHKKFLKQSLADYFSPVFSLFNSVLVENSDKIKNELSLIEKALNNGIVFDSNIKLTEELVNKSIQITGTNKYNNAFHKSWKTIQDTPQEILWIQQAMHYLTTYGAESLDVFDNRYVYIPDEKLSEKQNKTPLIRIKGITFEDLKVKIQSIVESGIALKEDTLNNILDLYKCFGAEFKDFNVKNNELIVKIHDLNGTVPSDPLEFLRYVIYKTTDSTLLIKNKETIEKITKSKVKIDKYFDNAPKNLASIFYRFKPLFLAFKKISNNKNFFNRLRKSANTMHEPLPVNFINSVCEMVANKDIKIDEFKEKLKNQNIFRKIKLAYALKYRTEEKKSIVYHVRNGKGWIADFKNKGDKRDYAKYLEVVLADIAETIKKNVNNKTIYIPKNIRYTLPATEKKFIGNVPNGTQILFKNAKNLVIGVHWFDTEFNRVDLDFSILDDNGSKIGWNSVSKTDNVLFSGDMTSAPKPKGASELFYIQNNNFDEKMLITLNNFNKVENVDFDFFVANGNSVKFNYLVDTNNIIAKVKCNISLAQKVLGYIDCNSLVLSDFAFGKSSISYNDTKSRKTIDYFKNNSYIYLDEVLELAGAKITNTKPENSNYIDFSIENLEKDSILKILT